MSLSLLVIASLLAVNVLGGYISRDDLSYDSYENSGKRYPYLEKPVN